MTEQGNVQPWRENVERLRERVSHLARACRSGVSHDSAVYEQGIDAALDALTAQIEELELEHIKEMMRRTKAEALLAERNQRTPLSGCW